MLSGWHLPDKSPLANDPKLVLLFRVTSLRHANTLEFSYNTIQGKMEWTLITSLKFCEYFNSPIFILRQKRIVYNQYSYLSPRKWNHFHITPVTDQVEEDKTWFKMNSGMKFVVADVVSVRPLAVAIQVAAAQLGVIWNLNF